MTASTVYAARYPHQPTISPPSIGPTSAPVVLVMELSALAAGSCSGGSSRAIIEERAGALSAKQTAWRATIAYSRPTFSIPAKVAAARTRASENDPAALNSPSLRRSTVSATAPP